MTGGTGYIGRPLIGALLARGHEVRALARAGSESRLPARAQSVIGDALDATTFERFVQAGDTFVHLVGVAKPAPWKESEFRAVDLVALRASAAAARSAGVAHFVYLSVAQPAPVMRGYQRVRGECEAILRETGLVATFLRPWYVLGPGHRWPALLIPAYWMLARIPATREAALRLSLVTRAQMVAALVRAVEDPPEAIRIVETSLIRSGRS